MKSFFKILSFVGALSFYSSVFAASSSNQCDSETAIQNYFCISKELKKLEVKMKASFEKRLSTKGDLGTDADKEIRERMVLGQASWEKYRDAECLKSYYSKAFAHSASDDYAITECKFEKTQERLKEIGE